MARRRSRRQWSGTASPVFEELPELRDFAAELPESFLQCRELGHQWRRFGVNPNNDGTFDRTLRCSRCHTKRIMVLSGRGVVLTSRYEHPDGYLSKGLGRITGDGRGLLRLESMFRELKNDAEREAS